MDLSKKLLSIAGLVENLDADPHEIFAAIALAGVAPELTIDKCKYFNANRIDEIRRALATIQRKA